MPFVIFINIIRIIFKYVLKFINYTGLLIIINIFYNYCYIKRKLEDDNNLDHSNTKRKLNQDNSDSELGSEQNSNSELEKSNSEAESKESNSEAESELDSNARAELGSELESESESKSESGLESKDSDSCPDLGHSSNETAEDDIGLTSGSDNPSPVEWIEDIFLD
jgi:hypothetical protein